MGRVVASVEVVRMARVTLSRSSLENIVDMACSALKGSVGAGERISRVAKVIKLRVEPTVHRMTALASGREAEPDVIDNRGAEVLLVAGITGRRQSHKLACRSILVAIFALQ